MTLKLMLGAAMSRLMHGEHKRRADLLIREWKSLFSTLLGES